MQSLASEAICGNDSKRMSPLSACRPQSLVALVSNGWMPTAALTRPPKVAPPSADEAISICRVSLLVKLLPKATNSLPLGVTAGQAPCVPNCEDGLSATGADQVVASSEKSTRMSWSCSKSVQAT